MNEFWNANGNQILMLLAEIVGMVIVWLRTGKTTPEQKQAKKVAKSEAKTNKLIAKAKSQAMKTEHLKEIKK
jgi:hypothetical protein